MIRKLAAVAAFAVCIGQAPVAFAAQPAELVFAEGVLDKVEVGHTLQYRHYRSGPDANGFYEIPDGSISLAIQPNDKEEGREAVVTMHALGGKRSLHPFPPSAGNPLIMVFMESSLRSMAQITGGSPFYIRNRMRDALRNKGEVQETTIEIGGVETAAQKITFHPFDGDPNREKMGIFADLEISFTVSEAIPGRFAVFSARTPDGENAYSEVIEFSAEEEVK